MINAPLGIICHGGAGTIDDQAGYAAGLTEAIDEGYRRLGGGPFLAKRVEVEVPVVFSSSLIRPPRGN